MWEPVLPLLAGHHDTIAVDMPGFGESAAAARGRRRPPPGPSPTRSRPPSTPSEVDRAHVAGNSLGGWVALEFAKSRALPERDDPLRRGLLGSSARAPAGDRTQHRAPARPVLRPLLATERGRRLLLRGPVAHPERVPARAAYRLVRAYALSPASIRANTEMRRTLFTGFEDISVPITMAWAEYDRSVSAPAQVPARGAHGVPRGLRPHPDMGRPAAGGRGDPRHRGSGRRTPRSALGVGGVNEPASETLAATRGASARGDAMIAGAPRVGRLVERTGIGRPNGRRPRVEPTSARDAHHPGVAAW